MRQKLAIVLILALAGTGAAFAQGTDTCPGTPIPSTPFSDSSGDTCGNANDVTDYASVECNSVLYPGPDVVYQVNIGAGNNSLNFTLTPAAADLGIFMVSDCTMGTTCLSFRDTIGGAAASTISQPDLGGADSFPEPLPVGTYYIYIDSYYAGGALSCGPFTLDVTGTLPLELLEFSVE